MGTENFVKEKKGTENFVKEKMGTENVCKREEGYRELCKREDGYRELGTQNVGVVRKQLEKMRAKSVSIVQPAQYIEITLKQCLSKVTTP